MIFGGACMYALIESIDRDLSVDLYDTWDEAEEEMFNRYKKAGYADNEGWGYDYAYKDNAKYCFDYSWKIKEMNDVYRKG